jgi:hypothetical protein
MPKKSRSRAASRRREIAFAFAVLVTRPALAEDERAHRWFFDGSVGAGYSTMSYFKSWGTGPVISASATPAHSRSASVAWGPRFEILVFPSIKHADAPFSAITGGGLLSVSGAFLFRPRPSGFELSADVGVVVGGFFGVGEDVILNGSPPKRPIPWTAPIGPHLGVRAGYVWPEGIGLAVSGSGNMVGDEHGSAVIPISVLGNVTYSSW